METVCRNQSALSDVQIHILMNSEALLQFASDLSHREIAVFVPGRTAGTVVLAARRIPLLQQQHGDPQYIQAVGTVVASLEAPIAAQVLDSGRAVHGEREVEYGRTEPLACYPFIDNGGDTIAAISFLGKVDVPREILTETSFMALQVPAAHDAGKLYGSLNVQDGVILINCNGVVMYADEMAESLMAIQSHEGGLVGSNIYSMQSNLTGAKQALATHKGFVEDMSIGPIVLTRRVIPLSQGGKVRRVIAILTEKTELRRKEEELMIKTSVIKEIHHRVKNNLQTIASLLRMQMRRTDSKEAKAVLSESLNRILSISLVHEILSHHNEETIDISDVGQRLLTLLCQSMSGADCKVEPTFHGESLPMPSDGATSLALVMNELITNAIVHGFEGLQQGSICLTIRKEAGCCIIIVADDGVGMEQSQQHQEKRKHLGLAIVQTLVEKDLHGTLEFTKTTPGGTTVVITFPYTEGG
ncbi:MAG: sensor histidine kinase [Megasphaera sp.]|jgi:two-component sensor histidine kinase/PAS domain-containing protein|nr:sensor histidine kinase [Megasphaera sp.]MCH4218624.1 sensor histidine kinase [Megasphaera sp.]